MRRTSDAHMSFPWPSHPRVPIWRRCTLGKKWNGGQLPADLYAWTLPTEYQWVELLVHKQVNMLAWWHELWEVPVRTTSGNLPEWWEHCSNYQRWVAMPPRWKMTTHHLQCPTPLRGTASCPYRTCGWRSDWNSHRRLWPMQRSSSIRQKKPNHQPQVNLANWWKCPGALTWDGAPDDVYRWGSLGRPKAIQLG